jgi:3-mercaptopyruvate sulfurtransferase SseA
VGILALKIYIHEDVRIMDGGRRKWLAEGRDLTNAQQAFPKTVYRASDPDLSLRAFLPEVQEAIEDLKALYGAAGITEDRPVIAYCRFGERSSHTWFVLKYLLGFENVKNYDGSWTEWGNLVGAPVEKP